MASISMTGETCALVLQYGEIQVKTKTSILIVALFFYLQSVFCFMTLFSDI